MTTLYKIDSTHSEKTFLPRFVSHVDAVNYLCSFELMCLEQRVLNMLFAHKQTGKCIQKLCFLARHWNYKNEGFYRSIFDNSDHPDSTLASMIGVKSKTTMAGILNEIRTPLYFKCGGGLLLRENIDFKGKIFAGVQYHRDRMIYWFLNYEQVVSLANEIYNVSISSREAFVVESKIQSLCLVKTKFGNLTGEGVVTPSCIPVDTDIGTQIGTPFTNKVEVEVEVEIEEEVDKSKHSETWTFPPFQGQESVGKKSKTNAPIQENIKPPKNLYDIYSVWRSAVEDLFKVQLPTYPVDKKCWVKMKTMISVFELFAPSYSIEELVKASVYKWDSLKKYLKSNHDEWKTKNMMFPEIGYIASQITEIHNWYLTNQCFISPPKLKGPATSSPVKPVTSKPVVEEPDPNANSLGWTWLWGQNRYPKEILDRKNTWEFDFSERDDENYSEYHAREKLKDRKCVDVDYSINMINHIRAKVINFNDKEFILECVNSYSLSDNNKQ